MNFEESKAIYLQIADRICDDIVNGVYSEDERLPSVREMASSLQVNANTVMRSYERLQQKELITNKRGIGFFVASGAKLKIIGERGRLLIDTQLDSLFALMMQMGITPDDLKASYGDYLKKHSLQDAD